VKEQEFVSDPDWTFSGRLELVRGRRSEFVERFRLRTAFHLLNACLRPKPNLACMPPIFIVPGMTARLQSFAATIQPDGSVKLRRRLRLKHPARAVVTVLLDSDEGAADLSSARLSQPALAKDWLRAEEDAAWAHLQPGR
jgi:hypothetical protein